MTMERDGARWRMVAHDAAARRSSRARSTTAASCDSAHFLREDQAPKSHAARDGF